jgi:hypothetical protein
VLSALDVDVPRASAPAAGNAKSELALSSATTFILLQILWLMWIMLALLGALSELVNSLRWVGKGGKAPKRYGTSPLGWHRGCPRCG